MSDKKPLVLTDGQTEQLQAGDDLDIPMQQQVNQLRRLLAKLVENQMSLGLPIEDEELLELLDNI